MEIIIERNNDFIRNFSFGADIFMRGFGYFEIIEKDFTSQLRK